MKTLTMDTLTLVATDKDDWKDKLSQLPAILIAFDEQTISEQELRSYIYFLEIDMLDSETIEYVTGFFSAVHASQILTITDQFELASLVNKDDPNYLDGLLNDRLAEYKAHVEYNAKQLREAYSFPE